MYVHGVFFIKNTENSQKAEFFSPFHFDLSCLYGIMYKWGLFHLSDLLIRVRIYICKKSIGYVTSIPFGDGFTIREK